MGLSAMPYIYLSRLTHYFLIIHQICFIEISLVPGGMESFKKVIQAVDRPRKLIANFLYRYFEPGQQRPGRWVKQRQLLKYSFTNLTSYIVKTFLLSRSDSEPLIFRMPGGDKC